MALEVLSDAGKPVDWFFMYKLPDNTKPLKGADKTFTKTEGTEYMYYDPTVKGTLALSPHKLDEKAGALYQTLAQIYDAAKTPPDGMGWICYNDEIPDTEDNDGEKGHTKGVLAFDLDSDTAFWLLHSWPKFADPSSGDPGAWNYGQTYLCVQLRDVDTARAIAKVMFNEQEPQVYQVHLPGGLPDNDAFSRLATSVDVNETDPPADITFLSKGGTQFRCLAKNRHWGKDFWIDLVGPHLGVDMDVETWRRGTVPDTEDSDGKDEVTDILYINLEHLGVPYEWHYTKDHAKWGVSETDDWVCVADINRQTSQEKRGGGTIAFRDKTLWDALRQVEQLKE
ncbi:MAG: deoxyribonuclease II family protein [Rhodobacter sp.]|nr:deoxyribonuclease II family protein [Rhodobacter sp.]